jgi:hypothetical protein
MYGFVYIWYDKKHKRYYIGSHWGNINDGYVCSSSWMKQAYKRRAKDFKRRILSIIITSKSDLLEKEQYFLSMIKQSERGIRYYNLSLNALLHWNSDKNKCLSAKEKMSKARLGKPPWNKGKKGIQKAWNKGLPGNRKGAKLSEETKEKMRQSALKNIEKNGPPKQGFKKGNYLGRPNI